MVSLRGLAISSTYVSSITSLTYDPLATFSVQCHVTFIPYDKIMVIVR